ncbi:hypothetical protein CCUS01_11546 [Colletotrichum cuscutae]|uniref:Uncharacterized protein n=1 Tax=Colletotrichum cuscutae TaxID=1209917 RepID=A0AAI9TYY8_9PEZI|nr:hypothetical protein CCUS01_11546 [Colletotrichum cuscutae]
MPQCQGRYGLGKGNLSRCNRHEVHLIIKFTTGVVHCTFSAIIPFVPPASPGQSPFAKFITSLAMTYYPTVWKASFRFFNSPALSVHHFTLATHYNRATNPHSNVLNQSAAISMRLPNPTFTWPIRHTGYGIRDPNNLSTRVSCPELKPWISFPSSRPTLVPSPARRYYVESDRDLVPFLNPKENTPRTSRKAAKVRNKGLANFLSHRLGTEQSKALYCRTWQYPYAVLMQRAFLYSVPTTSPVIASIRKPEPNRSHHHHSAPYLVRCPGRWPRLRLAAYGFTMHAVPDKPSSHVRLLLLCRTAAPCRPHHPFASKMGLAYVRTYAALDTLYYSIVALGPVLRTRLPCGLRSSIRTEIYPAYLAVMAMDTVTLTAATNTTYTIPLCFSITSTFERIGSQKKNGSGAARNSGKMRERKRRILGSLFEIPGGQHGGEQRSLFEFLTPMGYSTGR